MRTNNTLKILIEVGHTKYGKKKGKFKRNLVEKIEYSKLILEEIPINDVNSVVTKRLKILNRQLKRHSNEN